MELGRVAFGQVGRETNAQAYVIRPTPDPQLRHCLLILKTHQTFHSQSNVFQDQSGI